MHRYMLLFGVVLLLLSNCTSPSARPEEPVATASPSLEAPSGDSDDGESRPSPDESPTDVSEEVLLSDSQEKLAVRVGLERPELATVGWFETDGVAGWWSSMFVALWASEESLIYLGEGETSVRHYGSIEAVRITPVNDGPFDQFSCSGIYYATGLFGIEDNPRPDHLGAFTENVIEQLC